MDINKFKRYFLEGAIQIDEELAFESFCIDEEKIPNKGQVCIISARWCEKMQKYMKKKYRLHDKIVGASTEKSESLHKINPPPHPTVPAESAILLTSQEK